MIDLDFLQSLIEAIDASGLDYIEIERGGTRIRLAKTSGADVVVATPMNHVTPPPPVAAPAAAETEPVASALVAATDGQPEAAPPASDLFEIKSPMVGTFFRAPAPDAPPYAEVGRRVSPGDALCIIEAMKLMNELESEVSGVIQEICAENAEPVEFGQVLFRLSPS